MNEGAQNIPDPSVRHTLEKQSLHEEYKSLFQPADLLAIINIVRDSEFPDATNL